MRNIFGVTKPFSETEFTSPSYPFNLLRGWCRALTCSDQTHFNKSILASVKYLAVCEVIIIMCVDTIVF